VGITLRFLIIPGDIDPPARTEDIFSNRFLRADSIVIKPVKASPGLGLSQLHAETETVCDEFRVWEFKPDTRGDNLAISSAKDCAWFHLSLKDEE
jgi:hypothetical protein